MTQVQKPTGTGALPGPEVGGSLHLARPTPRLQHGLVLQGAAASLAPPPEEEDEEE